MKRDIRERKKRFLVFCLVGMFALVQVIPVNIWATDYTVTSDYCEIDPDTELFEPGDVINYSFGGGAYPSSEIIYYDLDGTTILKEESEERTTGQTSAARTHTIIDYEGTQLTDKNAFKGWTKKELYSSGGELAKLLLVAASYTQSSITYELPVGATNPSENPEIYYEGKMSISLADAQKTGYTFEGWYENADYSGTPITEIAQSRTGNISLYALFNPTKYNITYHLDGGNNGSGNPEMYTYGEGVSSFADASKDGYTFAGWYKDSAFTTEITTITTEGVGDVNLYAKFVEETTEEETTEEETTEDNISDEGNLLPEENPVSKRPGVGSIHITDVGYGNVPLPVLESATNGTQGVVIEYKKFGEPDTAFTQTLPRAVGTYVVRAIFPETDLYLPVIATATFSISYLHTPELPYQVMGTKGENDYYISNVSIVPKRGYMISDSLDGTYKNRLKIKKSTSEFFVYLKNIYTGEKTSAVKVSGIKIDKTEPEITGAEDGETIYGEQISITVKDAHLDQVLLNQRPVLVEDGKAVLSLSSNQGRETYEIIGIDKAGNRKEIRVTIADNWMETGVVPVGETVKLTRETAYQLGAGNWQVAGDSTTYAGNTTFYVDSDGDYSFTNTN